VLQAPPVLLAGARLFDAGAFFEAHEAWEEPWLRETDETRRLVLQGLIQIAAGLHKLLVMGSPASAARLLARGLSKLDRSPSSMEGHDLEAFRDGVRACATDLDAGRFDRSRLPRLCAIGDAA
jgi:uncharacterized protein